MDSYAQNFEDIVLARALGHVVAGVYVDVGAADPEFDSVTKLFSDRGWRGLNIEPVGALAERLRAQRPRDVTLQVAAGSAAGHAVLHQVADTGLSTLDGQSLESLNGQGFEIDDVVVEVAPLTSLIDQAGFADGDIHFLKVDVEGLEHEVLQGIDLTLIRPWIIVVEATAPRSVESTAHHWEYLLVGAGYQFTLFDGLNRFYVAAEHPELVPVLSYPACLFDQPFFTRPHREALERIHELEQSAATITAAYDRTVAAYTEVEDKLTDTVESYRRLEADLGSTVKAYTELERLHQEVVQKYDESERERLERELEMVTLRAGVSEMAAELDRERSAARAQIQVAEERAAAAEAHVAAVHASTSWRLTAPVRGVLDLGRRVAHGRSLGR